MSELTLDAARKKYREYYSEGLKMFPPFKGYGEKLLEFATEEPELYRILFLEDSELSYDDYLIDRMDMMEILPYIQASFDLSEEDAVWLFRNMTFYAHGMAVMCNNCSAIFSQREVHKNFGAMVRGLIMQLKAPSDDRIAMAPSEEPIPNGNVEEYIKGRKNVIVGYGPDKELFQIRLDAILYFEAVRENVFAYTRHNVYEIKQRLYQIEESISPFGFVRASKSLVVNSKKIVSVSSDTGGRGKLNMINGETVIASRAYYKTVLEALKGV